MKKIIIFLLIILSAFAISCKNKTVSNSIVVNMGAEPKTMDPTLNSISVVSVYIIHAFEGLTKLDSNNNVVGAVAEGWFISDDGLKYTFHLRTNAKWSDGKPITANDFEYSWKRAVNPNVAAEYAYMMEVVKNAKEINAGIMDYNNLGVKAIDDYTLEVILENPTAYFLEFIASTGIFMPVRKDIIETYKDEWTLNPETYIGNGPYKMTERLADQKIVFSVNTNYYSKEEQIAKEITKLVKNSFDLLWLVNTSSKLYESLGFSEERSKLPNFYDERLSGSYSIKKTLPVFSNLSYKNLNIKCGNDALASYATYNYLTEDELNKCYDDLKIYCRQDTWAMVVILDELRKLI